MTGLDLVERSRKVKAGFGTESPKKFAGAAAVEILREALATKDIPTSSRDVYVRGIEIEVDLVIPRRGAKPELGLVYKPEEVAMALEVKRSGCFGQASLKKVKNDFRQLRKAGIQCAYVTFEERRNYKWKATRGRLGGFHCFTLAWHKKTDGPLDQCNDWNRLVSCIQHLLQRSPRRVGNHVCGKELPGQGHRASCGPRHP
jgi:hypothetical protein